MNIISFGDASLKENGLIEFGGGEDKSKFVAISHADALIVVTPETAGVYYAIVDGESPPDVNRCKLAHDPQLNDIFIPPHSEIKVYSVRGWETWLSFDTDFNALTSTFTKPVCYEEFDTVRIWGFSSLPKPLVNGTVYCITNKTKDGFQLTSSTGGYPITLDRTDVKNSLLFLNAAFIVPQTAEPTIILNAGLGVCNTYTPCVTPIRNYHITNLRTRINNELIRRGKPTCSFTDPTLTAGATKVTTTHINELRSAAQAIAPYCTLVVTDNPLVQYVTKIKAVHMQEIDNYVCAREIQNKVTCIWDYASSTTVALPSCITIDNFCIWGLGGGGGGGAGGAGGKGGNGGSGGSGGAGGWSGCSGRGGNGGRGGAGGCVSNSVLAGGGGGGAGGAGTPSGPGNGGSGGNAGTAGAGGGGGGGGTGGAQGGGNIYSYPSAPCVIAPRTSLCIIIGSGGGSGGAGGTTIVCCSGSNLFTAGGGGAGSTGSAGSNGAGGTNGSAGSAGSCGVNGARGFDGAIGGSWGAVHDPGVVTPACMCIWGGGGGCGGADAGGCWLAGGGGGGGGSAYNWYWPPYGTRHSSGGGGGGGKGGGGGGAAAGIAIGSGGGGAPGGGGPALSGAFYGHDGYGGNQSRVDNLNWCNVGGGSGGVGCNPSCGDGGHGGDVYIRCVNVMCIYPAIGGKESPYYPVGTPGGAGSGGGARTGTNPGTGGSAGAGGGAGWSGYGYGGTGGTGGTGGAGGYGGAGGSGGTGGQAHYGMKGGCGGNGGYLQHTRINGYTTICWTSCNNYNFGGTGLSGSQYGGTTGGGGEAGSTGSYGGAGSAGGSGGSGYVRLIFKVWQ